MTKRIYLAIPTLHESLHPALFNTILGITQDERFQLTVNVLRGYGPVDYARNVLLQSMREHEKKNGLRYDFLLFIDDDTVPPPDVLDMALHDKPICSGIVFSMMKGQVWGMAFTKDKERGGYVPALMRGGKVQEVDAVGMACTLIRRDVLDDLPEHPFRFLYAESGEIQHGEDITFCALAKQKGHSVWVDSRILCSHFKKMDVRAVHDWVEQVADANYKRGLSAAMERSAVSRAVRRMPGVTGVAAAR